MMPTPPDAPLTVRLGARLGPEIVASILAVAVVIAAVGVALSGGGLPGSAPGPSPSVAPVASETPVPPSTAPPSRPARVVLGIVDRLLGQRASLDAELAKRTTDAGAIAEILRDVRTSLLLLDGPLTNLAAESTTTDLATRIQAISTATSDGAHRAQQASITNEKAQREGAEAVIAALEPLPAIRAELAALAGDGASPAISPTQATGTAEPSGATP